jgi:hypothetical protein
MRVVVTGGRKFSDKNLLRKTLDDLHAARPIDCLSHGGYGDCDKLAGWWAAARGIECRVYTADWQRQGRSAGPKRNAIMLVNAKPDLVVAFPGGRSTADCVRKARRLDIPVLLVPSTGPPDPASYGPLMAFKRLPE